MTDYGKLLLYDDEKPKCPHVTDFKSVLKILRMLECGKSADDVLSLFFTDSLPDNAREIMTDFIGKEYFPDERQAFSFYGDAGFIIAAFREKYGIDLLAENMHWHLFTALFMSLGSDTAFSKIIKMRVSDFSDGHKRIFARRFNSKYDLRK